MGEVIELYNFYQEQYKQVLNQNAVWFKKTGVDRATDPEFAALENIKVRRVNKTRLIKDRDGKEKVSVTAIKTIKDINIGDYVADAGATLYTQGREVLSTHDARDLDGNFIGKTVRL